MKVLMAVLTRNPPLPRRPESCRISQNHRDQSYWLGLIFSWFLSSDPYGDRERPCRAKATSSNCLLFKYAVTYVCLRRGQLRCLVSGSRIHWWGQRPRPGRHHGLHSPLGAPWQLDQRLVALSHLAVTRTPFRIMKQLMAMSSHCDTERVIWRIGALLLSPPSHSIDWNIWHAQVQLYNEAPVNYIF